MQVKDLTVKQLQTLIRETVLETLEDYLSDPDQDSELKEDVKQRLITSKKRTDEGERGISIDQAMEKLGLD
ncbi:MAG: hypothetical protein AB4058_19605 [Microcystaceae cyanobacterium]